jgi:beta-galactosidase
MKYLNLYWPFVLAVVIAAAQLCGIVSSVAIAHAADAAVNASPASTTDNAVAPGAADSTAVPKHTFSIGEHDFLLDGKPFQIRCGEIHAARVPQEYWRQRLRMAKAMGLNTVCAYLFWNLHEPTPGHFEWSGQADDAQFCRIAQEEGLWVILRPGPYSCAEWEMGGLPWWLLKNPELKIRTRDPAYLDAARSYLQEVGRVLGPLQIANGGPILMVQAENEYGSYGKDADYMGDIRQMLVDAGFRIPLFACNPVNDLKKGYRPDLFAVVNFGADPAKGFDALRKVQATGPLMCGEFYPGWFDTWGATHHFGNTAKYLSDLEYMLKSGASFSIYMAHGGTTFGLWSGADRPFKPDTTSYDYDAPISEAGWVTPKFTATRELFQKYLAPGETLPDPPAAPSVTTFEPVTATECAPVFDNLPAAIADQAPHNMEVYDQGHGCILYRTTLPPGPTATLTAQAIHDLGEVFLDGKRIGFMDRRKNKYAIALPAHDQAETLDILVEAMGRINFGPEIRDRKGILSPVSIASDGASPQELHSWQIFRLPLDDVMLANLHYSSPSIPGPAFWRLTVNLPRPADTFLDMHSWTKGVVWVNGHCLGRYWNIGPTQTMFTPGPWLKSGDNQIVVLDLIGPEKPVVAGLSEPVLNQLRLDHDIVAGSAK